MSTKWNHPYEIFSVRMLEGLFNSYNILKHTRDLMILKCEITFIDI